MLFRSYSEGEYYLDNIEVVKTTVAGITYYDYALRVDFGYEINHKELLANSATGVLEFDTNLAKVFNGDQELEVDAIELHSDGYLYIFTVDGGLSEADNGNITVSFTNPVDTESGIKYSTLKSPYPWGYEGVRNVYSFEGESAYADETISGIDPQKYLGPKLVSADPENGSFELPLNIKEFNFTYNKDVDLNQVKATLSGKSVNENLTVKKTSGEDFNKVVTFERSGSSDLLFGDYIITISDLYNADGHGDELETNVIAFSAGVDPNASTEIDSVFYDNFATVADGWLPEGWICYSDAGAIKYPGNLGGGSRMFEFAEGGFSTRAFYFRTNGSDTGLEYGSYTDEATGQSYDMPIKAGKIQITYWAAQWAPTREEVYVDLKVLRKSTMEEVFSKRDIITNENCQEEKRGAENRLKDPQKIVSSIIIPSDDNYVVKIMLPREDNGGDWASLLLSKVQIETVPSEAAYYKAALKGALSDAAVLLQSCSDDIYSGVTYDTHKSLIEKYTDVTYHSPAAYNKAISELENSILKLRSRKTNVESYISTIELSSIYLADNKGTKYEQDPSYQDLFVKYSKYSTIAATEMNDETIASVAVEFDTQYKKTSNSKGCIDALVKSIMIGVNSAEKLESEDLQSISNAQNIITDDNKTRADINKAVKLAWYKAASENRNINPETGMIAKYDEIEDYYDNDSIDMTSYVINPNLYTMSRSWSFNSETFPGWDTYNMFSEPDTIWNEDKTSFELDTRIWRPATSGPVCGSTASDLQPVVDVAIYNDKQTGMLIQKVEGLPAGIYNFSVKGSNTNDTPVGDRVFWVLVEGSKDTLRADYPIARHWAPQPAAVLNVELTGETVTIGTKEAFVSKEYATSTDDFSIQLIGKAKGFDYAQAYINGTDKVNADSPIVAREYYDLNGIRYNKPVKGLNIVKQYRMNGTVDVVKIINE